VRCLTSFWITCGDQDIEAVVVIDANDKAAQAAMASISWARAIVVGDEYDGMPQAKYNLGYRETKGEWVITGADDITFDNPGWIDKALKVDKGGFVGLYDGYFDPSSIAIHHMASRSYIDGPMGGNLGLPWYHLWFADVEWAERAKRAGIFVVCTEARITHYHHVHGNARFDNTYALNTQLWQDEDQATYTRRERAGFPNDDPEVISAA
jgi:hypothetical protein